MKVSLVAKASSHAKETTARPDCGQKTHGAEGKGHHTEDVKLAWVECMEVIVRQRDVVRLGNIRHMQNGGSDGTRGKTEPIHA